MKNTLNNGTQVAEMPAAIVIYNFTGADAAELSQIISGHPCEATVFIATKFDPAVFSQAENSVRTFIFMREAVDEAAVDPTYPAQWVSPGDFIPAVPGNVSIEAGTDGRFTVTSIDPENQATVTF